MFLVNERRPCVTFPSQSSGSASATYTLQSVSLNSSRFRCMPALSRDNPEVTALLFSPQRRGRGSPSLDVSTENAIGCRRLHQEGTAWYREKNAHLFLPGGDSTVLEIMVKDSKIETDGVPPFMSYHVRSQLDGLPQLEDEAARVLEAFTRKSKRNVLHQVCHV